MKSFAYAVIFTLTILCSGTAYADEAANEELYNASSGLNADGVRAALKKGADVNYIKHDRSVLTWSAQSGNAEVVEALLEGKPKLNEPDAIGHTPLMRAADMGHTDVAKALLKAGADPNVKTDEGTGALLLAVKFYAVTPALVQALLDAGADPNAKNVNGEFPMLIAVQDQKRELIPILAKSKIDWTQSGLAHTALGTAVDQGDTESVKLLLQAGADPNVKGESNRAPLIMAMDNEEIFRLLLDAKANPNILNGFGQTALIVAISEDNAERAEALIKAGADLSAKSEQDQTALQFAETQFNAPMVELLKRHGAK